MSKITDKERLEIYKKWKKGKGSERLSREYGIDTTKIRYLVRLIERHGPEILRQGKKRKYTKAFKEEVINKVLIENQTVNSKKYCSQLDQLKSALDEKHQNWSTENA